MFEACLDVLSCPTTPLQRQKCKLEAVSRLRQQAVGLK